MPVNNSGKIIKHRKVKGGTLHKKNHRWESFSVKVSKLNSLDPIRRVRRYDIEAEDLSSSTSYLRAGLEKWAELNMSKCFTAFYQEMIPMCDSLPQILHYEDKIMKIFIIYFEKQETESLEPLLELMTEFAHDLGYLFEKHYSKALEIIISIVGKPQDVEVIDWCFSSLTFIFKYLSKLLIPDLRPTYDLMAPLLGKNLQRPHIARFAAESLSFLVRKAGTPAHREKSLELIVNHVKNDFLRLKDTKEFTLYSHGLMTLFAEAIKGQGLSIHTSGPEIFQSMIKALNNSDLEQDEVSHWKDVICGVLISTLHHTNSDSFECILKVIIELANQNKGSDSPLDAQNLRLALLSSQMIAICSGVRKGSRIKSWVEPMKAMSEILQSVSRSFNTIDDEKLNSDIWNTLILSCGIIIQYASIETMACHIPLIMDTLMKAPLARFFLAFCSYLSDTDPERFQKKLLTYFRFVTAHWSETINEDALSILLPKISAAGVLSRLFNKDGFLLPLSWQDGIIGKFEQLQNFISPEQASPSACGRSLENCRENHLPKLNALLDVLECTVVNSSTNSKIAEILLQNLKHMMISSQPLAPKEAYFFMGKGLSAFLRMTKILGKIDSTLKPFLHSAASRYIRLPVFLSSLLDYEISLKALGNKSSDCSISTTESEQDGSLIISLVHNLSTTSHHLRLLSLRLLEQMIGESSCSNSQSLSIMIMVEEIPLDLQTSRSVSTLLRKLGTLYSGIDSNHWLKDAIPAFCFGMLTVKYSQIWEEACRTLKTIADSKTGVEAVSKLIISWLWIKSVKWKDCKNSVESRISLGLTDFECSNFNKLTQLGKVAESIVLNPGDTIKKKFIDDHEPVLPQPPNARSQALRVLAIAPAIAEKYSRQIVPLFLSWSCKVSLSSDHLEEDEEFVPSDWSRKDQKSLLEVFSNFSDSKSLYKSEDVHSALLTLLENGDIEIQRFALKAIFTWKHPSIKPYEQNLLNLLDEARFREELGYIGTGQALITAEHRPTLIPVLIRILYGRSMSRKSGRQGIDARRRAIFRSLDTEDLGEFIDISLGNLSDLHLIKEDKLQEASLKKIDLSARKLVGLAHMIESVLKELGTNILHFAGKLSNAVMYCLIYSSRQLRDDLDKGDKLNEANSMQISLLKDIRQIGMKCLILLFSNTLEFDWSPYINTLDKEILSPRLRNLPDETAQGISVMLRLFSVWSSNSRFLSFLGNNDQTITKITECLLPQYTKDEVKIFVLSIIKNLANNACKDAEIDSAQPLSITNLLCLNMDTFLNTIWSVLRNHQDLSKELLESCIETTSELAPFVNTTTQGTNLVKISVLLLDQPARRVSPKTKSGLLCILEHLIPLHSLHDDPELEENLYYTISSLFSYFKDKSSRELLSRVLHVYSKKDPVLSDIASVCVDLNSYKEGQLDEPDYDRRLKAFNRISQQREICYTARQWNPILNNMLYYIKHDGEFGLLCSNSSDGICQLISAAGETTEESEKVAFKNMFSKILLPAIFSGVRETSEIVRREFVRVMAKIVYVFPDWPEVSDMYCLLAGDDEVEASFFDNIFAPGKGKQSSALCQLSCTAEKRKIGSKNISQFFIPLLEHFIFNRSEVTNANSLTSEAIGTLGTLSASLKWPQYRATLRRFIGYIEHKPEFEKQIIRLLGKMIDPLASASNSLEEPQTDGFTHLNSRSELMSTLPEKEKLIEDLASYFLPPLTKYLHNKDESTVSLRAPIAIIIVKLIKILPEEQVNQKLPPVLTDICHILRSKAQESRDMARETLSKIAVLLGPSCFGFILKELRGALFRGSQLHVLSYTMHSLLVETTPKYAPGDLDYCISSIATIVMDDVFGATGQEKDAEDYTSKLKEVKSSKSHDSMELIAKTVSIPCLKDLVQPIYALLKEKLTIRILRKIDELFIRISNGLMKNSATGSRDILIFCYQIIQDVYKGGKSLEKKKDDYRSKKYLIQKGAKKSGERGSTTIHTYKMVRFALDILRLVLKKHDNLRTPANLADFIPILGDAVVGAEEELRIAAFKLLTSIVKVHPKTCHDTKDLYRVAVGEALKSISTNSSTVSEISQASLKFISGILRDRQDIPVKETAIDNILMRVKEEMTQPDRCHVIFNFLRVILDCKIQTAVLYDTLDYVGTVMVTNDDKETRNLSRGAYFQFLRDYPQMKNRWSKQLTFIVANLNYDREGGRLSILEVIHLLLSKSAQDFVQEVSAATFVPLIFVLANDESEKCRMAAGELLKTIFSKADSERIRTFLSLLRSWIKKNDNVLVIRLAYQAFSFFYESENSSEIDIPLVSEALLKTLQKAESRDSDWEEIYFALELVPKLIDKFPTIFLSSKQKYIWLSISKCLSYPHLWVKLSASKLISIYFAHFASSNTENDLKGLPMKGSHGLELASEDIIILVQKILRLLQLPELTQVLADEAIKNLFFMARIANTNNVKLLPSRLIDEKNNVATDDDLGYDTAASAGEMPGVDKKTLLHLIFGRLSYIFRRETVPPRFSALIPKIKDSLTPYLSNILLPLSNITDPNIPTPYSTDDAFRTGYEELKANSEEILEILRRKLGTQAYSEALLKVREIVKGRRTARSIKRRIEAVSLPEKYGENKKKKLFRKKERRKERGAEHRRRRIEV
ncbi:U3 small nucleolar RNA-associated protein 20 [Golovinomyces cichoracearum]|uniref:U3 small nucleolar RNA-associated protein 20 n=1 Tax=Golovinomyces cichoracearum TaxID=62708 RepID=A0A420HLU2_9PEZI|nr:U3 small nucleolar RNA-associated protein 20 [Golovinomyces cichoracearum]